MSWYNDVYSSPHKHGLSLLGSVDFSDGCYQFDYCAVWKRDSDGQLFYGDDSGCSCPSPFETFNSVDQLTPCTWAELHEHLRARNEESKESYWRQDSSSGIADLMARIVG